MPAWFDVDKAGLAKLLERRGKSFVVFELVQNCWDTGATKVDVEMKPLPGRPVVEIRVTDDDPKGFSHLNHSFTLFAESEKKSDPSKRGRFNLGEKLVLALCETAEIVSTTGGVRFNAQGRTTLRRRTARGSYFWGEVKMTRAEYEDVLLDVQKLLPPHGVVTRVNGEALAPRAEARTASVELPTEIADEEGFLRRTSARKTTMRIFEVAPGEKAMLYEIGIPVMETGDTFHVDIAQKVPLTMERDAVPPAYLRAVRTFCLNAMSDKITADVAAAPWVQEALTDKRVSSEAVTMVLDKRFGLKRVIFDPSDQEGTKMAAAQGYTVIPGGTMPAAAWENIHRAGAALPAGQVTPSPKPFHPGGSPLKMLDRSDWTTDMKHLVEYAKIVAKELLTGSVQVEIADDRGWGFNGSFGQNRLIINAAALGRQWFSNANLGTINRFLIHEFGHNDASDHLSEEYHRALCKVGAKLASLALARPEIFKW